MRCCVRGLFGRRGGFLLSLVRVILFDWFALLVVVVLLCYVFLGVVKCDVLRSVNRLGSVSSIVFLSPASIFRFSLSFSFSLSTFFYCVFLLCFFCPFFFNFFQTNRSPPPETQKSAPPPPPSWSKPARATPCPRSRKPSPAPEAGTPRTWTSPSTTAWA